MAGATLPDEEIMAAMKAKIVALSLVDAGGTPVPVLTRWPENNQKMPFINIEQTTSVKMTDKDNWGNSQIYTVNMWSRKPASDEINDWKNQITETMTDLTFTLPSFQVLQVLPADGAITIPEEDKQEAWHGVLPFRIETYGQARG